VGEGEREGCCEEGECEFHCGGLGKGDLRGTTMEQWWSEGVLQLWKRAVFYVWEEAFD
jgi:hypothetical protein